ncbi:hypothetical protein BGZ54_005235 [Gamsiella multidivaricata]|nr:hypothetical protein BGZ54_005235 [Gamsiella multidivaricata]
MTHLSDYSFTQRAIANGWFYLWFVTYVFRYDRFQALNIKRILRFELRSIVTLLLLIAIPLHLIYDIGCAMIKYQEGFWSNPISNEIISRPSFLWSQPNQDTASALDYALACSMALLTSIFFLLQSFYHYISKSVTKSSFMSSFEFRLNIVCSFIVIALFPLLQFLFRNNLAFREAAPQMAFSIVTLIIGFLGVRTHFRFKSLLKVALLTINENTQGVAEKLEYFKDMNLILTFAMMANGVSLGIASADGLTSSPIIAHNKFASDFLIANLNFFEFIIWVTLVLIFYPRRSVAGSTFGVSTSGGSRSRTVPVNTQAQNQDDHKLGKNYTHNSSGTKSGGRSNNNASKNRPPSIVVPYRAPENSNARAEYIDLQISPRHNHNHNSFGYNDHDTYPLTQGVTQDRTDAVQMNTFKPIPTAPIFGVGVPRQSQPTAATTRVGQHTFALEDAPGVAHQRAKAAMQQQQQQAVMVDEYGNGRPGTPTTPTRARKEFRSPPTY